MNGSDKYHHSAEIDMPLCLDVMKSTQPLVKAIEPLFAPRLKIIEIGRGIIVLKRGKNGLGNKLFKSECAQTKATLTNYIKLFTLFIREYLVLNGLK